MSLPKLLIISPTVLFPLDMGAKVRILNILKATYKKFDITFLSTCDRKDMSKNEEILKDYCSDIILLPSLNRKNLGTRIWHRVISSWSHFVFKIPTELYYAGLLNLSKKRLEKLIDVNSFDVTLFEYWYTANTAELFKRRKIPRVLDTHNILWKKSENYYRKKSRKTWNMYFKHLVWRYKELEEKTWHSFDGIITINAEEDEYIRSTLSEGIKIMKAGTGLDLNLWPYSWNPTFPPKVIFYGSLGGLENRRAVLTCIKDLMPQIWNRRPDVKIWFVGANPPSSLINYAQNESRTKVTGYIENVKDILASGSLLLCPFEGQYGFRGRIIEAMALGLPVIASSDAVYGMELENRKGISICDDGDEMVSIALEWLNSPNMIKEQSLLARKQIEETYSFQNTYGKISDFLMSFQ